MTKAIAAATAAAGVPTTSGNTVFLPAGAYCISSPGLTLQSGVTLAGTGWNRPGSMSKSNFLDGSWIITPANATFSPVTIAGDGAAVRNVAFAVQGQGATSGPPPADNPTILVNRANCPLIEDIMLYNPYGGIYLNNSAQAVLRRIFGQPLQYGIKIDGSQDTNCVESVHFWPFWQTSGALANYQQEEGIGIDLRRCDNPHLSNIFVFNYNTGLNLAESPLSLEPGQTPHKVHLTNADFDNCVTGINIDAQGTAENLASIQLANVTTQAPPAGPKLAGSGIMVTPRATYAVIQASNLRVSQSIERCIDIEAEGAQFFGENVMLQDWHGDVGFFLGPKAFAYLGIGFVTFPQSGTGTGGDGQFTFAASK